MLIGAIREVSTFFTDNTTSLCCGSFASVIMLASSVGVVNANSSAFLLKSSSVGVFKVYTLSVSPYARPRSCP